MSRRSNTILVSILLCSLLLIASSCGEQPETAEERGDCERGEALLERIAEVAQAPEKLNMEELKARFRREGCDSAVLLRVVESAVAQLEDGSWVYEIEDEYPGADISSAEGTVRFSFHDGVGVIHLHNIGAGARARAARDTIKSRLAQWRAEGIDALVVDLSMSGGGEFRPLIAPFCMLLDYSSQPYTLLGPDGDRDSLLVDDYCPGSRDSVSERWKIPIVIMMGSGTTESAVPLAITLSQREESVTVGSAIAKGYAYRDAVEIDSRHAALIVTGTVIDAEGNDVLEGFDPDYDTRGSRVEGIDASGPTEDPELNIAIALARQQ